MPHGVFRSRGLTLVLEHSDNAYGLASLVKKQ